MTRGKPTGTLAGVHPVELLNPLAWLSDIGGDPERLTLAEGRSRSATRSVHQVAE